MYHEFRGKTVIVTGASTGIGRGAAIRFGAEGAKVVVVASSSVDKAEEVVQIIRGAGGEAMSIRCDVSDSAQVEAMVKKTVETYGSVDFAFNNAGIGPDGVRIAFGPLTELSEEVWDRTMAVNAKGVFLCMKYELLQMQKQGHGAIVNTASVGGLRMAPGFGAYGPSKAAVIAVTRAAALENARAGIRVNVVCPGPTMGTELSNNSSKPREDEPAHDPAAVIPMGKMGQVDDVANAVLWLCSDQSGHITGHALSIDGGMADIG